MLFAAAADVGAIRPVFTSSRLLGKSDETDSFRDGVACFDSPGFSRDVLEHCLTAGWPGFAR